jgi:eukaryotic-like serine/threonine-protein kinase
VVSPCPPEDDLLAFSSGDISQVGRVTLLGHLAECDECRVITSELSKARLGSAATAARDAEGTVEPNPPVVRLEASPSERPPFLAFAPGEVLAGKFKVVKILGAGGMGVVIEAEHLLLERRVALKFMGPELMADPEATARFLREARAASLIPNEHVVKILDVDTLADGTPYIVMERLYGHDLASVIEREGRLEASRAVGYVLEAMEALAHAHAKGIVHRDLKPANLFLANREDGTTLVKVLDFGIAKSQDANGQGAGVTTSRTVLGSPRYMAPEQMQSAKAADMRADIWALGTILFELVSGRPAFEGETLAALTVAICAGPPPSLASAFPSVSDALDRAVSACLSRPLEGRFSNVAALALALAPLAPASAQGSVDRITALFPSGPSTPASVPPARAVSVPPAAAATGSTERNEPKSRRVAVVVAVASLLAVGVLGIGRTLSGSHSESSPSSMVPAPSLLSAEPSHLVPVASASTPSASPSVRPVVPGVAIPAGKKPALSASVVPLPSPPHVPSVPRSAGSSSPYDERK